MGRKNWYGEDYDDEKWGDMSRDEIDEYCQDREDKAGIWRSEPDDEE